MAGEYGRDGIGDALIDAGIRGQMQIDRKLIGIKQRQSPTHDLLGTTERIAVECCKQARDIECRRRRDRKREAASARNEIGEDIA